MKFDGTLLSVARMSIIAVLLPGERLSFTELKRVTNLADGNLHVQCKKLFNAGYIEKHKSQGKGRPKTFFSITPRGRNAVELHIKKLMSILDSQPYSARSPSRSPRRDDSQVW